MRGEGGEAVEPPRYQRLAEDLMARLRAGEFPVGSMLPTEIALASAYGVSRHTVRAALDRLESLGLVRRLQGSGTSVAGIEPADRFAQEVSALDQLLQYPENTRLFPLRAARVTADDSLAARLRLPAGDWVRIDGVRRVKITAPPISLATIYLRAAYADILDDVGAGSEPVYAQVAAKHALRISEVAVEVSATSVDVATAQVLDVEAGTPGLLVERRYLDQYGRVFEVSSSLHPAERFRYAMLWRRAPPPR